MLMPEEYYIVEAKASEWVYVIQKFITNTANVAMGDVVLSLELSYPVYYLRRDRFNGAELAKVVGTTPSRIEAAKVIRLEPFKISGNLPKPTVPYSGEA